jgi:endonuclease/exonuclease/phosphatase family metal-dependent hydrolase
MQAIMDHLHRLKRAWIQWLRSFKMSTSPACSAYRHAIMPEKAPESFCFKWTAFHAPGWSMWERRLQIQEILVKDWIITPHRNSLPLIQCGDFKAGPQSFVYKKLSQYFFEVPLAALPSQPKATFPSHRPLLRIDHIFISPHFHPTSVRVPEDNEKPIVSDHLPVYCELALPSQGRPVKAKGIDAVKKLCGLQAPIQPGGIRKFWHAAPGTGRQN